MKSLKRTLICFACASVMLFESAGITAAAEGYDSVVSESFNECVTNGDVPEYIVKNGKRIVVKDYGKKNASAYSEPFVPGFAYRRILCLLRSCGGQCFFHKNYS